MRALGLALHLEPAAAWGATRLLALGARLLAHVEAAVRPRLGGRGRVERHLGSALWGRDVVHGRHLERGGRLLRWVGAACVVDVRNRQAAAARAAFRYLADRVETRPLGRLALDVEGVRFALTVIA